MQDQQESTLSVVLSNEKDNVVDSWNQSRSDEQLQSFVEAKCSLLAFDEF